jgi:N-glycosylase/DNA lyase
MNQELLKIYFSIKPLIEQRINEFKKLYKASEKEILFELLFCLLTPQSRANICWSCIEELKKCDILNSPSPNDILKVLNGVRFKYKKSQYVAEAIRKFSNKGKPYIKKILESYKTPFEMRKFLVKEVKGLGMKEASHFLRNIGKGEDLAILDRHILKNLKKYGVIKEIPKNLSLKKYLIIEEKMRDFSKKLEIPLDHLDLVLWYKETGEVFK